MAKRLQLRRGTTSQHGSFTGALGEVTVDITKDTVVVHDGSTAGGFPLVTETVAQTLTNKTLTSPVMTTPTLGTVSSGTLEDSVTYRNINQDLGSGDSPTFNNPTISQLKDNTHYRSNFISHFPYAGGHSFNSSGASWATVVTIRSDYGSTGKSWLAAGRMMAPPPTGYVETFHLHIAGGFGSGSPILVFRLRSSETSADFIAETEIGRGWVDANSQWGYSALIGAGSGSETFTTLIRNGSNKHAAVDFRNANTDTPTSGNVKISQVVLEQRIKLS